MFEKSLRELIFWYEAFEYVGGIRIICIKKRTKVISNDTQLLEKQYQRIYDFLCCKQAKLTKCYDEI